MDRFIPINYSIFNYGFTNQNFYFVISKLDYLILTKILNQLFNVILKFIQY